MNGDDERGIVPTFNSSYSTVKIDSLCIKLGVRKEKDDDSKCSHFSIRGYVAGMRERVNNNVLPFTDLPPMEVPNFRYWRCEKCLQNYNEAANASTETALISVNNYALSPPAWPHPRQDMYRVPFVPFGEGTSGSRAVDDAMVVDLEADESQNSEELTDRVNVPQEPTRLCITDSTAGKLVINELIDHENSQGNETISQPLESGQEIDNYQNGHPKRKTRKVRLLKELLCGNTKNQQPKENSPSSPPRIKRKTLHDHDNENDQHHDDDDRRDPKRSKSSKAAAVPVLVPETNVTEPSRNPGGREFEESINRYEWNKTGAQRSSVHGRIGSDPMTAWRSIFSDMGRTENRAPLTYSTPRSRATEPYPNFMNSLKSDKRVSASKKIPPSNPIKSKFFLEDSRRMQDESRAGTGLGLDLSLNNDPHSNLRSQLSALNRSSNQDFSRKPGFFSEASNFTPRIQPDSMRLLERPVSFGGCSGHQKLDFSDPYKKNNTGVGGYSDFTRPNNNNNHQRQENMFSIGRSDEREVIELLARNQFERSLSEANKNRTMSGFHKPMNEQRTPTNPEYLNMIRPRENVGPMRSPPRGFFHQDRVSNFAMNQKKPFNGGWMSDVGPQRRYDYDSLYHYALNGNGKRPQTHLYSPSNTQPLEGFNKYNSGTGMQFGQAAKYSEKDKGKNMMNLDLNLVAEEQNNFESLDVNRNRMSSLDSSYSNADIPAMQLLNLMDAGKLSHEPFSLTGHTNVTKPKPRPNSFSHGGSTVTDRTSPFGNPIGTSHTSVLLPSQNANLTTSSHGQQVFHGSRGASLASGGFQPVDSVVFPFPWQAGEGRSTIVNRALGPRLDPVNTDVCVLNQNPADISSPGPDNPWMINAEDLVRNGERSNGQIVKRKP